MEPLLILVDGYNVIRNTPGLAAADRVSLAAGREALVQQLRARYRHTPHRVVVVFDGTGSVESIAPIARMSRGQIVFTRQGETADTVIARRAAEAQAVGERACVCSDDMELRTDVRTTGSRAMSAGELAEKLNAPDRHQRRLALTRRYLKQQWAAEDTRDGARQRPGRRGGAPR